MRRSGVTYGLSTMLDWHAGVVVDLVVSGLLVLLVVRRTRGAPRGIEAARTTARPWLVALSGAALISLTPLLTVSALLRFRPHAPRIAAVAATVLIAMALIASAVTRPLARVGMLAGFAAVALVLSYVGSWTCPVPVDLDQEWFCAGAAGGFTRRALTRIAGALTLVAVVTTLAALRRARAATQ